MAVKKNQGFTSQQKLLLGLAFVGAALLLFVLIARPFNEEASISDSVETSEYSEGEDVDLNVPEVNDTESLNEVEAMLDNTQTDVDTAELEAETADL